MARTISSCARRTASTRFSRSSGEASTGADWLWLGGQGSVINAKFNAPDGPICTDLREAGALLAASADFRHSYPHSWRSKAKVIYRCTPQWFVAMDRPLPQFSPLTRAEQRWENEGGEVNEVCDDRNPTLRELAMNAIAQTRFVPEKGRNRIGSMVEQRPDWVLSRQRAWGVPIALFVERKTGQLLVDHEVNQRIVAAVREQGVDAWDPENAAAFLGNRNPDDYEMVTDILDVWFDSGCTHVFTLESGRWPDQRWPADLYLEGSDQHRGWFQSSLLESCGTRGRAPFNAVLTHGFTMDAKGMKMSKSLGNTISPLDLMKEHGADILRLWALSVDFTEDHRIGKEILGGVADQYRKLRNTFRYLLGALDGFREDEKVGVEAMPELERYMLHLTGGAGREAPASGRRLRLQQLHAAAGGLRQQRSQRLLFRYPQGRPLLRGQCADGRPDGQAPRLSDACSTCCSTRWCAGCSPVLVFTS